MYYTVPSQWAGGRDMVFRDDDGAWIPDDPANRDYSEYLQWVAEGNTAEPYDFNNPPQVKNSPAAPAQ